MTSTDADQHELPELIVEYENTDITGSIYKLDGRRLVDLSYVLDQYEAVALHSTICTGGRMKLQKEYRKGIFSVLTFGCDMCDKVHNVYSDRKDTSTSINVAMAWGTVAAGMGYSQAEEFCNILNLPIMSRPSFMKYEKDVEAAWEAKMHEEMKKAIEDKKRLAIEDGCVDEGMPFIKIIVDGGWSKRSYGHS